MKKNDKVLLSNIEKIIFDCIIKGQFEEAANWFERAVFMEDIFLNSKKGDSVAMVFGSNLEYREKTEEVVKLYKDGYVDKIILSGGIGYYPSLNAKILIPEGQRMREVAKELGVPDSDLLVDDKSRNTSENVVNSYKLIKGKFNFEIDNLCLVSTDYHIKRCLKITEYFLKKNGDSTELFTKSCKYPRMNVDTWKESLRNKGVVTKELLLLRKAIYDGNITDFEVGSKTLSKNINN